jgi:hypothetical protein
VFNPDMAVIGNFIGAAGNNSIEPMPALRLNEAEASFQAVVDPYARADFFLSASPDGLEVEEGFITFPTLPGGLLMKVGKMRRSSARSTPCTPTCCHGWTSHWQCGICLGETRGSTTRAFRFPN